MCFMLSVYFFFFFKQKTAYEMRISDWSSDVCSSDLAAWRRLRASGLSPAVDIKSLPQLGGLSLRRVAAALQIPLLLGATAALARSVLNLPDHQPETV